MGKMISKGRALELVEDKVETKNLRKHMYAVSAIMKKLAEKLGKDVKKWGLTGLLHDIDYEETKDKPEKHALRSVEMLEDKLPEDALYAIKSHNFEHLEVDPEKDLDNALIAADAISGLMVATALVMPNKKLEEVRVESVLKKFNDSSFAKNVDRDRILFFRELGLSKEEFIEISLEALKEIHGELGL